VLTEQDHLLIDRHLKGELDDVAARQFSDRLHDPEFNQEVTYRIDLLQALRHQARVMLKEELKSIESRRTEAPRRNSINMRWLAIAASVAFLVTAAYFLLTNNEEQDLYAMYFQPVPNVVAPITKGDDMTTEYNSAFRAYESGDYKKAATLLQGLDQADAAVAFFLAITHMHLDNFPLAANSLDEIAKNNTSPYRRHAQWFQMLAEYRLGEQATTDSLLTIMALETDHPYHTEALDFRLKK
jgi:hypothetical protein